MKEKTPSLLILKIALLFCCCFTGFVSAQTAMDATTTAAESVTPVDAASAGTTPAGAEMTMEATSTDQATAETLPNPVAADSAAIDSNSAANSDAAANAASAAEASTAEGHSQYGLGALWEQGDVIARGTLIIMIIMSAATWYVLVTKLIQQQGLLSQAKATQKFWASKDINESLKSYEADSAFRVVAEDGVLASKQHAARTGEKVELGEWVALQLQRSVERVTGQLQNGLSLLATVGSCSPFVGLFGTVWGIYHALIAIGLAGQASIDKVAGPVGEALIMTAIGLAVAVPAVLGYNWLVRRNKVIVDSLRNFAGDIHANLVMGVRGGQSN